MADRLLILFAAVIFAQFPIAVLVHIDAKRLGLKNPHMYELGIIVPMGGLLVVPWYVSRRKDLPRADEDAEAK